MAGPLALHGQPRPFVLGSLLAPCEVAQQHLSQAVGKVGAGKSVVADELPRREVAEHGRSVKGREVGVVHQESHQALKHERRLLLLVQTLAHNIEGSAPYLERRLLDEGRQSRVVALGHELLAHSVQRVGALAVPLEPLQNGRDFGRVADRSFADENEAVACPLSDVLRDGCLDHVGEESEEVAAGDGEADEVGIVSAFVEEGNDRVDDVLREIYER